MTFLEDKPIFKISEIYRIFNIPQSKKIGSRNKWITVAEFNRIQKMFPSIRNIRIYKPEEGLFIPSRKEFKNKLDILRKEYKTCIQKIIIGDYMDKRQIIEAMSKLNSEALKLSKEYKRLKKLPKDKTKGGKVGISVPMGGQPK